MKELITIKSEIKPNAIQLLGNNTYYYNHNIKSCKIHIYDEVNNKNNIVDGYEFTPVYIKGVPEYKNCVKNTIRLYLTQNEEFDLINSYNKTNIFKENNSKSFEEYKKYLEIINFIKVEVKEVFNNLNT